MMKTVAHIAAPISPESTQIRSAHRKSAIRWKIALLTSLAMASVTAVIGIVIGLFELLGLLANEKDLSVIGTVLLVSTFPIAMFSAHCLEKAREAQRALREECRRNNL